MSKRPGGRGEAGCESQNVRSSGVLVICLSANILQSPEYLSDDLFAKFLLRSDQNVKC